MDGDNSRMIETNVAKTIGEVLHPKTEIQVLCKTCGHDLDRIELTADTCSACGEVLTLQQNTTIYATSIPAADGSTLV